MDVLAIGGGGGGMHACSSRFADVRRAGDGGASRVGRYLRAGGGKGGSLHSGWLQIDFLKCYCIFFLSLAEINSKLVS